MATGPAFALEFCVGTPGELDSALIVATSPTGQTTVIKVKQGTYHIGSTILTSSTLRYVNATQLLGGYNSDCSVRTINPDNTVFDADGANRLEFAPRGDFLLEGIRFQNIALYRQVEIWSAADDILVRVRNNAFAGVGFFAVSGYDPDFDPVDGLSLKFVNNRVHGFPGSAAGHPIAVYMAGLAQLRFTGNTIADNAGEAGVYLCANEDVALIDNIGWNNSGDDFRILSECFGNNNPGDAQFKSNLYLGITVHTVGDSGDNIGGSDPLFVSAANGNYRLQAASPAVNSGFITSSMAGVDLDGHPRVVGSTVDRGAYEAAVDDTIPVTLTVTNANDSGAGSLRQAITDANANPDFTFINFDILGACPRTIAPASALPAITQGVRIDAFSQPGSAANTRTTGDNATRCIVLDGGNAIGTGLVFSGSSATQFWLQGTAIEGFTGTGLRLSGGTNALVWGNQFGGKLGALTLAPNGTNILLTSGSSGASIGGTAPVQRNVIAGAVHNGIETASVLFLSSTGNSIVGNVIGTYGVETAAAGNDVGIWLATGGNTVSANTIVNSAGDGVHLEGASAHDNTIDHNRIGVADMLCIIFPTPHCFDDSAPNQQHGVRITGGAHDNHVSYNTIWNNAVMGISVAGTGKGNQLAANSIYVNGSYGIDLDGSGNNDNDADPNAQNLPNRGLNYPVIARAYGGSVHGWVEGSLASINDGYLIHAFSSAQPDNASTGEGEVFHASKLVSISNALAGQNGSTTFRMNIASSGLSLAGRQFSLTAIDFEGNTSEFSARAAYLCDVIFRNGIDDAVGDQCPP